MKTIISKSADSLPETTKVHLGQASYVTKGGRSYKQSCFLETTPESAVWRAGKIAKAVLYTVLTLGLAPALSVYCRGAWKEALTGRRVLFLLTPEAAAPTERELARRRLDGLSKHYFTVFADHHGANLQNMKRILTEDNGSMLETVTKELDKLPPLKTSCRSHEEYMVAMQAIKKGYQGLQKAYKASRRSLSPEQKKGIRAWMGSINKVYGRTMLTLLKDQRFVEDRKTLASDKLAGG